MKDSVECYAGSTYPERPRSFLWGGQRYRVDEILARRREPDGVGFRVSCTSGADVFDLFYNFEEDQWVIRPAGSSIKQ